MHRGECGTKRDCRPVPFRMAREGLAPGRKRRRGGCSGQSRWRYAERCLVIGAKIERRMMKEMPATGAGEQRRRGGAIADLRRRARGEHSAGPLSAGARWHARFERQGRTSMDTETEIVGFASMRLRLTSSDRPSPHDDFAPRPLRHGQPPAGAPCPN